MSSATRLLESERRQYPQAIELARALSLASWIDPPLIRSMRLALPLLSDPGVETDLWFSPLVQVRSRQGLTLLPAVVAALRAELAAECGCATARRAWQVIARLHGIPDGDDGFTRAAVSPVLALEETITYLATLGGENELARVDLLLGRALASIRDQQDRGVARWAVRTLPRLPEKVRHSAAALALAHAASVRMGGIPVQGVLSAPAAAGAWTPQLFASLPPVNIGLRIVASGLEISEPPAPGSIGFTVPETSPLILDVRHPVAAGWSSTRATASRGGKQTMRVPVGPPLRIGTIDGAEARLLPRFEGALTGVWLLDRTERGFQTQESLNEIVQDLGWSAARFTEGIGSESSVVVWRFDDVGSLTRGMNQLSDQETRSRRRPAIVWAGEQFVVPSQRAVDMAARDAVDQADRSDSDVAVGHGWWTYFLLEEARQMFEGRGQGREATPDNLRLALVELMIERAEERIADEKRKRTEAEVAREEVEPPAAPTDELLGREDVIAELTRLTSSGDASASAVILLSGAAGVGKSAIARAFAESEERTALVVGQVLEDVTDPGDIDRAFLESAQELYRRFGLEGPYPTTGDAFTSILPLVGRDSGRPEHALVLLFDGLDGRRRDRPVVEVLERYLPAALPPNVFVIATARNTEAESARLVGSSRAALAQPQVVDLDHGHWQDSARHAIALYLRQRPWSEDPELVDRVLSLSAGNFRVAQMLVRWLESRGDEPLEIPADVELGLPGVVWLVLRDVRRLPADAARYAARALGMLMVAREPLPLIDLLQDEASDEAPWALAQSRDAAAAMLAPLMPGWDPRSDRAELDRSVIDALAATGALDSLAADQDVHGGHDGLLDGLDVLIAHATHASPSLQWAAGYRARYGLEHALESAEASRATSLCASWEFLSELIATVGYDQALIQLDKVQTLTPSTSPVLERLRVVRENGAVLARAPQALTSIAHDYFRRSGRTADEIRTQYAIDSASLPVHLVSGLTTSEDRSLFEGHAAAVTALATTYRISTQEATSPAVMVSGDAAGVLHCWDLQSGRPIWTSNHHSASLAAAAIQEWAFGPQATRRGMSGDASGRVAVWGLATGELQAQMVHSAGIVSCAISPEGGVVAAAGRDGSIVVGQLAIRGRQRTLEIEALASASSGPAPTAAAALGISNKSLVVVWKDGRVEWRPIAPDVEGRRAAFTTSVTSAVVDRRGTVTALLSTGVIASLDTGAAVTVSEALGHRTTLDLWSVAPLDKDVAVGRHGEVILVPRTESPLRTLHGHRGVVRVLAREDVPDRGEVLVSGAEDFTARLWNPADGLQIHRLGTFGQPYPLFDIDADERQAFFPVSANALAAHDLTTGARAGEHTFDAPVTVCRVFRARFPENRSKNLTPLRIVAVGLANGVVFVATDAFARSQSVHTFSSPVSSLACLDDGSALIASTEAGDIASIPLDGVSASRVLHRGEGWDTPGPLLLGDKTFAGVQMRGMGLGLWRGEKLTAVVNLPGARITALANDPQSPWVAVGRADGAIEVVRRADLIAESGTAQPVAREIANLTSLVTACLLVPGSSGEPDLLVGGAADGRVVVYDPASGERRGVLSGHTRAINGMARFPDGRRIATWSLDGTLCVWDVRSQRLIGTTYSRAPFISGRVGASGRVYAFDAFGQAWVLEVKNDARTTESVANQAGSPPAATVRVGGNIEQPTRIRNVDPIYPPIAQTARIQGAVILEATIGPDGLITDARVLRSVPLLDQAALDAVKQWQYTPTLLNGVPVSVIMTITVTFTLR